MSEEMLPSLLASDRQAALFSMPASFQEKLEQSGQYTAERLFLREPDKYRTIVAMLAAGRGVRAIKRACSVHHDTIAAVAARERLSIDTLKERIVKDIEVAIQVGAERAVEVMETIKPEQMLVGLGILIDKYQLLTGGATMRVETSDVTPGQNQPQSFDEWLATQKPAKTGLGGGEKAQRAGGLVGDLEVVSVHRLPTPATFGDAESLASQSNSAPDTTEATSPAAEPEPEPAAGADRASHPGEGGVEDPGGAVSGPTHSPFTNFAPKADSLPPGAPSQPSTP